MVHDDYATVDRKGRSQCRTPRTAAGPPPLTPRCAQTWILQRFSVSPRCAQLSRSGNVGLTKGPLAAAKLGSGLGDMILAQVGARLCLREERPSFRGRFRAPPCKGDFAGQLSMVSLFSGIAQSKGLLPATGGAPSTAPAARIASYRNSGNESRVGEVPSATRLRLLWLQQLRRQFGGSLASLP